MRTTRILTITLLALLLAGCQEAGQSTTTLRVRLSSPRVFQRALIPSADSLGIDHFVINATGPREQTVQITTDDDEVLLGNLSIGWWTIEATAYNSDGIALVRGAATTLLSSKTNHALVELSELVGTGTLELTVCWDVDQVADDVSVQATLYDQELAEVTIASPLLDREAGSATIRADLSAGSYFIRLQLFSQGIAVSGAGQAVRIVDSTISDGTIDLVIGDISTAYTLVVVNKTGLPIEGTVTATPDPPAPGQPVTMVYEPIALVEGMHIEDLSITWYCEGVVVHQGSSTYVSTPAAGTHRYDVIVNHPTLGSMGSTSLLLAMPLGAKGGE